MIITGICKICRVDFNKDLRLNKINEISSTICRSCIIARSNKKRSCSDIICEICGKQFHRCKAHEKRSNRRFCSHACSAIGRIKTLTRKCTHCSKDIVRMPHQFRNPSIAFCSLQCRSQNMANDSYVERLFASMVPIDIKYIRNDRKTVGPLELDFYFPEINLAVELNGESHYRAVFGLDKFRKQRKNDRIKKEKCQAIGVKLYSIKLGKCTADYLNKRFSQIIEKINKSGAKLGVIQSQCFAEELS